MTGILARAVLFAGALLAASAVGAQTGPTRGTPAADAASSARCSGVACLRYIPSLGVGF